jgi:hypothetical protein
VGGLPQYHYLIEKDTVLDCAVEQTASNPANCYPFKTCQRWTGHRDTLTCMSLAIKHQHKRPEILYNVSSDLHGVTNTKAVPLHAMKALGGRGNIAPIHSPSGQRHAPAALYSQGKDPSTYCTGGWVDHRARLDTQARGKIISPLPWIEPSSPGRSARNQTLY